MQWNKNTKIGAYHQEDDIVRAVASLREQGYEDADLAIMAKRPDDYQKTAAQTRLGIMTPKDALPTISAGLLIGGAVGAAWMLFMETQVFHFHAFGFGAAYPLLGVILGLLAGCFIGALCGWYVHLARKSPDNVYQKQLNGRLLLLLVNPNADGSERVQDIFKATNGVEMTS